MTRGQVLHPITAPQNIFLSPSPTVPAPFAAFCPHPRPVTARVVPIPTPLPQSRANKDTPFPGVEKTMDIFWHFVRMFWDFIWIYVNSFYFLHFVRNVIVLLIFNIAAFTCITINIRLSTTYTKQLHNAHWSLKYTGPVRTYSVRYHQLQAERWGWGRVVSLAWLLPSLALTLAASLYNTMVPVTAGGPGASSTDHRLTVLHAANRAETASAIMPSRRFAVSA